MRHPRHLGAPFRQIAVRLGLRQLQRDEHGTAAIEFAIVSVPFFMMIFALIGISAYFFVFTSLDRGMDKMSRQVRTGEAAGMTVSSFKQGVCDNAGGWIECPKVQVFVQSNADWSTVTPQSCLNSAGQVVTNTANGTDLITKYSGGASDVVVVTTCYKWALPAQIPFFRFGNMSDGSMMMQSTTALRSEPYAGAATN